MANGLPLFSLVAESQLWAKLNHWLAVEVRLEAKREANPSLVSLDSQSVKASETGSAHDLALTSTTHKLIV